MRVARTILVVALALPGLAEDKPGSDAGSAEARRQLARLRAATDPDEREAALRALAALGQEARAVLQAAVGDPDPDIRFHALFLLQAADVRVERHLRAIVEGHEGDAGTYPAAAAARNELLAEAGRDTPAQLLRLLRRHGSGDGERASRYACVALDLLGEVLQRQAASGELPPGVAAEIARSLDLALREGFTELTMALSALPREEALSALRSAAGGGTPRARSRAARLMGELLRANEAAGAVPTLVPLLRDPDAEVRLAALHALDALDLPPDALIVAAPLARDLDPQIAGEALRILSERGLVIAREPAEALAGSKDTPLGLRLQAVVSLGLLGQPGPGRLLAGLARQQDDRELATLAAWALCAVREPGARELIDERIADPSWAQEDALYFGLARIPAHDRLAELLSGRDPFAGARRSRSLLAMGRCRGAAAVGAVEALGRYAVGDPLPTADEFKQVTFALHDLELFQPEGCPAARAALARLFLETSDVWRMDELLALLSRVGGTDDKELQHRLVTRLTSMVTAGSVTWNRKELAADALAKVDPETARRELARILPTLLGSSEHVLKRARSMARSLARAGDPSFVAERALAFSMREMEEAPADQRAFYMNNVGIDLLYGRRFDEAIVEFRRMLWSNPRDSIAAYNIACGHALAGRPEESLRYLRRAIRSGYDDPRHMIADTDLDVLHKDARFQRIFRGMLLQEETGQARPQDYWR